MNVCFSCYLLNNNDKWSNTAQRYNLNSTSYSTDTCSVMFTAPLFTIARNGNNLPVLQLVSCK